MIAHYQMLKIYLNPQNQNLKIRRETQIRQELTLNSYMQKSHQKINPI